MLTSVIGSGQPDERRVTDDEGHTYRMTTKPYMISESGVFGAVITLVDIDALQQAADRD